MRSHPHARAARFVALVAAGLLIASLGPATVSAADDPMPTAITHEHFNFMEGLASDSSNGTVGFSAYRNPRGPICTTETSTDPNVNADCEYPAPHNETSVAVDPNDANHLIASANDYQLRLSNGGTVVETTYSRAHVSNDGGQTWTSYPIYYRGYTSTGDPAVAFDAAGNAYLATLGFTWSQNRGCCVNPDILVASSTDGGQSWSKPARVASGSGSFGSPGIFNDKPFLTAWGDGNAIATWTRFEDGLGGGYIRSPIYATVTHDAGRTWSAPREISGSAAFCIGAQGGNACDQSQASVPAVAADGSIYVAFLNSENVTDYRDQYLVVKLDAATGARVAGPYKVGSVIDGINDYPLNIDGRQTYQDSQFRTWSAGNITVDPTDPSHLAVVWSDMRNSTLPAPADPYSTSTNSDIVVSQSFDAGQTWGTPTAISSPGDQFMPWGAYDASGALRIGYFDRSYDPANHAYGYTLATESPAGSLTFSFTQVTDTLSDPTQATRWFSGRTPNPDFPNPTTFIGDYSGIATGSSGVVSSWTDLRESATFGSRTGTGQDLYIGVTP